jgi:beta-aspartyl-dipeptidase (metallo-type)
MFTLICGGEVYTPECLGVQDILCVQGHIIKVAPRIEFNQAVLPVEKVDAVGQKVVPGFIDGHVHIIGGGGEGGYRTRTPEIMLSDLTTAGITTVIGLLGTDGVTRNMNELLAKARALEEEGVSAYIYTGAYQVPTRTITDNVRSDLVLIDKVLGTGEIALSDHRSAQPSFAELAKLSAEARVGGILGGKAGVVHFHMGEGKKGLAPIFELLEHTDIPITQFIPTHVNRSNTLLEQSVNFAHLGGVIDLTAGIGPEDDAPYALTVDQAIHFLLSEGIPINQITVSSDGNGSLPQFDRKGNLIGIGIGSVQILWEDLRAGIKSNNIGIEAALRTITVNPARVLKLLPLKGQIAEGADADIVILNEDLSIDKVLSKGRLMVSGGHPRVWGTFEKSLHERVRRELGPVEASVFA